MSSYRDPILHGDVYPSEEEIDPTGVGLEPASDPPAAYPEPTMPDSDRDGRPDTVLPEPGGTDRVR
ncbi:hypothetical protein [Micromonospora sp. NPDC092111]|uniref:hypothetical protein n=1 Tax=Micromonospora sp. NPDC092111 TaxID=3364289 RepID=UPI0037F1CD12